MQIKPGTKLRCVACPTEVVVIRSPADEVTLTCGGHAMSATDDGGGPDGSREPLAPGGGVQLGKRYFDEAAGLEVLCTKAGNGTLACDGEEMGIRTPQALPSSD